ncbi:cryptochrome-1-like [Physella acuta]|uniref:cryptochrome-1-like n=1 Tax=Physella acuta TaxID=109671 RepID=UPI0027DD4815|nr:cryptochrome-1-like [Physella acuta]XP_059155706.1 cryptochrome-1-like [Physella acuta]XP_059155707.1 cryptochrome-1-like [Physella acuta]XP_059155708.1 cryptochrome-1-like [Physella acuta]
MTEKKGHVTVHWFRHGLRLHDNPSLLDGLEDCHQFYPVFIFDGSVAGIATAAFPRMQFLLQTLQDLDDNLRKHGTRLYTFHGDPVGVFKKLFEEWGVTRLTFEQDPEPCWQNRDNRVKDLCAKKDVEWIERISHTLWDPQVVIQENGGSPPLTYAMFCQVTDMIGLPPQPEGDPDFHGISLPVSEDHDKKYKLPTLEQLGVEVESERQNSPCFPYLGGETQALKLLAIRLEKERMAFSVGQSLPNQLYPELSGMSLSLSPHLRFGSMSIRRFYWALRKVYSEVHPNTAVPSGITCQLIWREYFYCMSVNNPNYNKMIGNPICLNIDWYENDDQLEKWTLGKTGYPWIDACMRQLTQEGWIHQVCRHATACFLTRGDLWINWMKGLEVFDKYLLDADWSVCAGNWMWVSSSAFEKVLQCPRCICPVRYGRRMDPKGEYVRRYVPELKDMPLQYLFEPWKAPLKVQKEANCVVGEDYPHPMIDHKVASKDCQARMERIKAKSKDIPHIRPADELEVLTYMFSKEFEKIELCTHNDDKRSSMVNYF